MNTIFRSEVPLHYQALANPTLAQTVQAVKAQSRILNAAFRS